MELSGLLVWAALLVSLIAFIVFLVKSFKAWGVWMTIGFVILFIESWTFLIMTAGVNSKRIALAKQHDQLYKQVRDLKVQRDEELFGKATDPDPDLKYFVPLINELNRTILERGRAWRGARVTSANANSATIELPTQQSNLPPDTPAGVPGAAVPAPAAGNESLSTESVVYVFGEDTSNIPQTYLGEFKVTTVNNATVTIVPTSPLLPSQQAAINQSPTWAIYEVIPLDSHTAFARVGSQPKDNGSGSVEEIFGTMNPEEISQLLKIPLELASREPNTLDINQSIKAKVLQSYLRDGMRAPEGTPLNSLVYEVTFLQDFTLEVDANEQRNAIEGGYFDLSGRSVDARLKRDAEAGTFTFKANEKGTEPYRLDGITAKQLESEGKVKLGAAIFVRPLNDYEFAFREARRLKLQADQDAILVKREIEVVTRSSKNSEEQLLASEEVGRRLEKDKSQYDKEFAVIESEANRLSTEIEAKKKELSELYSQVQQFHAQLVNIQIGLSNAIDQAAGN